MHSPVLLVGPSGVGKGTIFKALQKRFPDKFLPTVSHTTRSPRQGEVNGIHYHFVTKEVFEAMIENNEFREFEKVHENYYGTSYKAIQVISESKKIVVMDVDVGRAIKIFKNNVDVFIILLLPPNLDELEKRIRGRGTETEESLQKRLNTAKQELVRFEEHNEIWSLKIVNTVFEETVDLVTKKIFEKYKL